MLPLRGGDVTTVARFHPGARRLFFCRMKCKPSSTSSQDITRVKVEDESKTSDSGPMMTSTFATSSNATGPGTPGGGSVKKKKTGVDRKYVSIQCTGYLKSWPCTKVGLGSDFSDQESVDESSMSCLVAVARLQPSFSASIEDCVERGQRTAHGVEFTSRHGTDGKFSYVDQRVTLILGYTPQELLGTSLYEHIQFDDIPAISECHRTVLRKPEELVTPFYRFKAKDGTFVKLESKWKQFRNPWTKEIEYLISKNFLLISDEKIIPQMEGGSFMDSGDLNFFSKSCSSSAENSQRSSPQGSEIQRVITNYADAAKIGRKIADEAREKRAEDSGSSASNSPMSVSAPSPQSYLQRTVSTDQQEGSSRQEQDRERPKNGGSGVIVKSKTPVTPATTSRTGLGGRSGVGAAVSLSEQILQGAANAKRNSPGTSSASSEGNDDAAMAVIMSLLEADAGLGGPVDFSGLPWPLP